MRSWALLLSLGLVNKAFASSLLWANCTSPNPPGLQCSQLEVPLNWTDPSAGNVTLGLIRLLATDPANRIGSLLINNGGPGALPSILVEGQAEGAPIFDSSITSHFDIVALEPRGMGISSPISCDPDIWNERVSSFPTNEQEFQALKAHNKALGESCLNRTGPLVGLMDTESVARDMEAIRVALDDGKLNYLGLSYGSLIGSQYAQLYPDNIRVMALDGIVDHSQSETTTVVTETSTYQATFEKFVIWCSETKSCPLYRTDIPLLLARLLDTASKKPIPAPACVKSGACRDNVTAGELVINMQGLLLFQNANPLFQLPGWNDLAQALLEASRGNATTLSSPIVTDPSTSGSLSADSFAASAVQCLDWTHTSANSLDKIKYKELLGSVVAPDVRGASQSWTIQVSCVGWPLPATNPPKRLNIQNKVPILLINAFYDPSTSYVWANGLLEQYANATLLSRNGAGHTSYLLGGDTTKAINAYLVNGTVPAPDTVLLS